MCVACRARLSPSKRVLSGIGLSVLFISTHFRWGVWDSVSLFFLIPPTLPLREKNIYPFQQLTHIVIIFLLAIFGQRPQVDQAAVDFGQTGRSQCGGKIDAVAAELRAGTAQIQVDEYGINRSSVLVVVMTCRMVARRRCRRRHRRCQRRRRSRSHARRSF